MRNAENESQYPDNEADGLINAGKYPLFYGGMKL